MICRASCRHIFSLRIRKEIPDDAHSFRKRPHQAFTSGVASERACAGARDCDNGTRHIHATMSLFAPGIPAGAGRDVCFPARSVRFSFVNSLRGRCWFDSPGCGWCSAKASDEPAHRPRPRYVSHDRMRSKEREGETDREREETAPHSKPTVQCID